MKKQPGPSFRSPLVGGPPPEVPLPNAPLVSVVAQIRFATMLTINEPEVVADLQKRIGAEFPVLRLEHAPILVEGNERLTLGKIWRFVDESETWMLSLSQDFIALETRRYESRQDFLGRLGPVLVLLQEIIGPKQVLRLGIRYVDRICDEHVEEIESLVRRELLGILATPLRDNTILSVQESLFKLPDEKAALRARWGFIPARMTPDPAIIPIDDSESWVLDLDVFSEEKTRFEADALIAKLNAFAERAYTVFRWSVTDTFLTSFGGKP